MHAGIERVLVQASSRSWKGASEICMNVLDGRPVLAHTLARFAAALPDASLALVAPEFDRGGAFETLGSFVADLDLHFGHDADPLARLVDACAALGDDALVARVDGQHCFADTAATRAMALLADAKKLDCVKLPDDFPPALASEVYRVGALRRLAAELDPLRDAAWRVHPKFAICRPERGFAYEYLRPRAYSHVELRRLRERARSVYAAPRQEGDEARRLRAGDQSLFHYELAAPHLDAGMRVLEAACGDGAGTRFLAARVAELVAVDLEPAQLPRLRALRALAAPIEALAADVCTLPFPDARFDAITSFETIEHTDPEACLASFARVLRPRGLLVLSTPQSSLGRVPLNPHHRREFSFREIIALVERRFRIRESIGIKAGRLVVPDDPIGTNTVLVCEKQ
jgi:SAM-dependent methyltransferase